MQETLSTAEDLQDFLMRLIRVEYLIRGLQMNSAASDLINARLTLAKDLLLLGNSIAETSSLCGYSSDVYFMHQFKKLTGFTPSEWLDQQKNTL